MYSNDETLFYKEIGSRISYKRKKNKITQKDMAKSLNIPQSTFACYETGSRRMSISMLLQIANLLKSDIWSLCPEMKEIESEPPSELEEELETVMMLPEKQQNMIMEMIRLIKTNMS